MAKLPRAILKLFGSTGPTTDFAKFGSTAAGSTVKTKDIATIQSLAAWLNGFKTALASGTKQPYLEDMNAVLYVLAYQMAYALQEGVSEYDAGTTYYIGSIVKKSGTNELYSSLTDNNTGNDLPVQTDNTNWKFIYPVRSSTLIGDILGTQIASLPTTKLTGQVTNDQILSLAMSKLTGLMSGNQIADDQIIRQFVTSTIVGSPFYIIALGDTLIKTKSITTTGGIVVAVAKVKGAAASTVPLVTLDRDGQTGSAVAQRYKLGDPPGLMESNLILLDNPAAGTHSYSLRSSSLSSVSGEIFIIEIKK